MTKKRKKSQSVTIRGVNPLTGDLIKKAETAELVYGILKEVGTLGPDGVQRAFVDIQSDSIEVDAPNNVRMSLANEMYGVKPTSVASETEPFPLIPKYDEPDFTPNIAKETRTQLRQILRKLVDEV